jgi:hypothetical protein
MLTAARRTALVALATPLIPAAALAGAVYVPLPGVSSLGTATYQPQVAVSNAAAASLTVQQVTIAENVDGTVRTGVTPTPLTVQGGRTTVVQPAATFRGLLEISGSPNARYAARLAGQGSVGALGVALPVISDRNLTAAGGSLTLQGLRVGSARTTWLVLTNLGGFDASCTLALVKADGATPSPATRTVTLEPLSMRLVSDLFTAADATAGVSEARVGVSCTRNFHAYALSGDSTSGEVAVVEPSGSGESTLVVPGTDTPCPTAATCFHARGVVLVPTPAKPTARVSFTPPATDVSRLVMSLDVTVGPFYPADPAAKHLIYWFVINKNKDMPGMLYFRGPNDYTALARHGIGLTHPQKRKIVKPFQAVPGRTYRVVNDYDLGRRVLTITITDVATGEVRATLTDSTNVSALTLKTTDRLLVDVGFIEGVTPDEVPSYGWTYSDVRLEVHPR